MGAVASLMYMKKYKNDPLIQSLILDSPFSSLREIMLTFANKKSSLPEFLLSWGIDSVNE